MAAALVMMAGVAFCTVSCQEDPITGPAEFGIVDTIVEVPAEGGEFSATYFLENPVLGEEVLPTCSDSWVSGFNTLTAYEITFTVSANMTEGEPREAVVNVEYNGENIRLLSVRMHSRISLMAICMAIIHAITERYRPIPLWQIILSF